ncbi:hypothetical protein [Lysobacter sp. M15]|uniref:hypothetical protein n=1 Tax=Lysobacter sp. M15 TaxID=2916837 RepID=UPI001F5836EA|nr:hypothetical protein [Lysobacter sp. M15]
MRGRSFLLSALLLSGVSTIASAQTVHRGNEQLDPDRPEAWAMHYFTATSFMTGFGQTPTLRPGQWAAAVELGHVPSLSDQQQRVGFSGSKSEDLNKSPVIGRLRGLLGLPGGWVAELGYTPPVEIDGARPRALVAAAIGRLLLERGDFSLSARLFGQHGSVSGDITCPAELAGVEDGTINPYGCRAPSDDRLRLNYYGLELTPALRHGAWQWHASLAAVRVETEVQVDALTYGVHDLSRLTAKDVLPAIAFGTTRGFGRRWRWGAEVLYVPLQVQRDPDRSTENDPLTSVRLHLRYEAN